MAKELSIGKLDRIIKSERFSENSTIKYGPDDAPSLIEVTHTVSVEDMSNLVMGTVSNLFREDASGAVVYCPEFYEVSLAANILSYYTNLKDELGNDRLVALLYGTDMMPEIVKRISAKQYQDISCAINQRVSFICDSMLAEQKSKLNVIAEKLDNAAAAFMAINEQFASVDPETYQRAVDNLGKMTPKDFAGALVNGGKNESTGRTE